MVAILGPSDEWYYKTDGIIVGEYVNTDYDYDERNDWHYVTISVVDAVNGVYRWSNRAGFSWTLTQD